ncbi:MAG: Uma2 family endonuclease [Planctomycetota bacterium]|nr:Uma2 family endonuclease [Planctomycetota bacterium]
MSDTKIYPTTYLDLPCSDGLPMGETEAHGLEMSEFLRDILRDLYADNPMVYVASNNFVYYDPSDVKKSVCPDCYVIKGIEKRLRDSYQAWAEGGALPCLIFELTSHSTWRSDVVFKRRLYQSWGCHEYFLYDLTADKLPGHLLAYRLQNGVYQEIEFNSQGRLWSEELQLELGHYQGHLRFFRPGSEQPIATRFEKVQEQKALAREQRIRAEQAELELERERTARDQKQAALEEENRRLKEEVARLKKDT